MVYLNKRGVLVFLRVPSSTTPVDGSHARQYRQPPGHPGRVEVQGAVKHHGTDGAQIFQTKMGSHQACRTKPAALRGLEAA
jgi:hypothetical protein